MRIQDGSELWDGAITPTPERDESRPTHSRVKRLLLRLTFSVVVFLVTLRVVDLLCGAALQTTQRFLLHLVPSVRVRHVSSEFDYEFRTNSWGLRGSEVSFQKPPETIRIVVLGDSFVAGNGVSEDETFVAELERLRNSAEPQRRIGRDSSKQTQVINVGATGISTVRAADLYQTVGRRFRPDVVILAYYVGNDLTGIVQELTHQEFASWRPGGLPRQIAYSLAPHLYLEWKLRHPTPTVFGRVIRSQSTESFPDALRELAASSGYDAVQVLQRYLKIPLEIRQRIERGELSEHRALLACLDPGAQRQALFPTDEFFDTAWPRTTRHLDQIKQAVEQDGAQFVLVIIPTACQIDLRAWEFNQQLGYEVDRSWLKSSCRTTDALQAWAGEHGVPLLDFTEPFRRSSGQLYYPEDTHLTPVGHAYLAKLLNQFLEEIP